MTPPPPTKTKKERKKKRKEKKGDPHLPPITVCEVHGFTYSPSAVWFLVYPEGDAHTRAGFLFTCTQPKLTVAR